MVPTETPLQPKATAPSRPSTLENALLLGIIALALAIGLVASVSRNAGGILLIVSWAWLLRSIHKLGRSGPA